MVRKHQVIHNQVIPKAHQHGVSSCALHQYDLNGTATNILHYHYQLCIFWFHNIEAKRCKVNNDNATYLWHCRLGHIGVKRMKKLHADGILESLDYESLDACEPCLMGKMTKDSVLRNNGVSN